MRQLNCLLLLVICGLLNVQAHNRKIHPHSFRLRAAQIPPKTNVEAFGQPVPEGVPKEGAYQDIAMQAQGQPVPAPKQAPPAPGPDRVRPHKRGRVDASPPPPPAKRMRCPPPGAARHGRAGTEVT